MSSNFESLANLPGHIASFSASAADGKVINETRESTNEAKVAVQLLHDASALSKATPALQSKKLKSVTVTLQDTYHSYTVSNGLVFGIQRETDA